MKVNLTPDSEAALNSILEQVRKLNPEVGKSRTIAVNQIIQEFVASVEGPQLEAFSKRLISPSRRRSTLLKRVAALTADAGPEALQAFEKSLNKLGHIYNSEPKKASVLMNK